MLNPSPTPEQIGKVREIVNISSKAEIAARINEYCDQSDWIETLSDVEQWDAVKNDHTIIEGDGVKINNDDLRLTVRNRVRVRLGHPEVSASGIRIFSFDDEDCETKNIDVAGGW